MEIWEASFDLIKITFLWKRTNDIDMLRSWFHVKIKMNSKTILTFGLLKIKFNFSNECLFRILNSDWPSTYIGVFLCKSQNTPKKIKAPSPTNFVGHFESISVNFLRKDTLGEFGTFHQKNSQRGRGEIALYARSWGTFFLIIL